MKRNVIALICAAVVAVALLVPAGLQGLFAPKVPAGVTPTQTTSPQDRSGVPDGTASATSSAASDAAASEPTGGTPPDQPEYVPGEILVGLADGVTVDQLNARLADLDYVATKSVSEDDVTFGYVQLQLADGVTVEDANARITSDPLIEAAQPNYIYHLLDDSSATSTGSLPDLQTGSVPDDALSAQVSVINDPGRSSQWALEAVHAYQAWDTARANNSVTVAVIDSGIDIDHPDLQERVVAAKSYVTDDGSQDDGHVDDVGGHGTHVAGIIAATTNNGEGVSGVSYNAKIMPVKVIRYYYEGGVRKNSTNSLLLADALGYVSEISSDYNVRAINISIGSSAAYGSTDRDDELYRTAVNNIHQNDDILVVYAAANTSNGEAATGPWQTFPCDYDVSSGSVGVINVQQNKDSSGNVTGYSRSPSSNYNMPGQMTKELSAPGTSIYSTTNDGSYGYMSGTSMAAPCVSGIAALVFAADPSLKASQVKTKLTTTAQDIGAPGQDEETGDGLVDADAAVRAAKPDAAPVIGGSSSVGIGGTAEVFVSNPGSRTWTWTSSNTAVATVAGGGSGSPTATVTGVATGTVTITATSNDNIVLTYEVTVAKTDLGGATVAAIQNQDYTGKAIMPEPTVTYGDTTLKKDVDYTVAYSNNVNVTGAAVVTVTGKGDYGGTKTVTFSIRPASIESAQITVGNATYNGAARTPAPTVAMPAGDPWNGRVLAKGVDYDLSYADNVEVSKDGTKAKVTVTGKGNFTGSVTREFSILQAPLTKLVLTPSNYLYNGTQCTPLAVVYGPKDGKDNQPLTVGTDYALTTPDGRTEPGTYPYSATGQGNYTGTVNASLTISKGTISSVNLSKSTYVYDGTQKSPSVTVIGSDGRVLTPNVDYTLVTPAERKDPGEYTYIAKPMGNYVGSDKTATLTISKASLSSATISMPVTSLSYTGSALRPAVIVKLGGKTLANGIDYTVSYSNNVNIGTSLVTITGKGNYSGTRMTTFKIIPSDADAYKGHSVQYRTHVQNVGWQSYVRDGAMSGTSGRALRLEGINISLANHPYSGSIRYRTHVQNIGWQGWRYDGAMSGTSGQSLRLEAIRIELTGQMAEHYDVYYRVHAQNVGWMAWAKNGESAGTAGYAYRLEGIQIVLRPKGSSAPTPSPRNAYNAAFKANQIQYRTHVQDDGWQSYVSDGATAGTSGRGLRLEGINIKLGSESGISGGVEYRTHVQNIGWQGWKSNGAMSGTSGQSLRLEAIQIRLTGNASKQYDIYYRVHSQNIGWMGWAKNGAPAGTAGYAYRLEAIQIKLVPKGGLAPGTTAYAYRQR